MTAAVKVRRIGSLPCPFCVLARSERVVVIDSESVRRWKRDCDARDWEMVDDPFHPSCDAYRGSRSQHPCVPCEVVDVWLPCASEGCDKIAAICWECADSYRAAFAQTVEDGYCADHVDARHGRGWREDYGLEHVP